MQNFSLDVESIIVRLKDSYEQYNDILCTIKVTVVVMVFNTYRQIKTSCILGIISGAATITYIDKLQFLDITFTERHACLMWWQGTNS